MLGQTTSLNQNNSIVNATAMTKYGSTTQTGNELFIDQKVASNCMKVR